MESTPAPATPASAQTFIPQYASGAVLPYVSIYSRARWAVGCFVILILLMMASMVVQWLQMELLQRIVAGEAFTDQDLQADQLRWRVLGGALLPTMILLIVFFLMWMHRAHKNLPALNCRGLAYSPGWAVGYWFIPILNLFRPYQVMCEIQKGSDPSVDARNGSSWQWVPVLSLLGWWWAAWLISSYADRVISRMERNAETAEAILRFAWPNIVSSGLNIVAAILAIRVILVITRMQADKSQKVDVPGEPPDYPPFQAASPSALASYE